MVRIVSMLLLGFMGVLLNNPLVASSSTKPHDVVSHDQFTRYVDLDDTVISPEGDDFLNQLENDLEALKKSQQEMDQELAELKESERQMHLNVLRMQRKQDQLVDEIASTQPLRTETRGWRSAMEFQNTALSKTIPAVERKVNDCTARLESLERQVQKISDRLRIDKEPLSRTSSQDSMPRTNTETPPPASIEPIDFSTDDAGVALGAKQ